MDHNGALGREEWQERVLPLWVQSPNLLFTRLPPATSFHNCCASRLPSFDRLGERRISRLSPTAWRVRNHLQLGLIEFFLGRSATDQSERRFLSSTDASQVLGLVSCDGETRVRTSLGIRISAVFRKA